MGNIFFYFLLVLFFLAVFLREDFVFTLLYLLMGAYLLGRFWGKRGLKAISIKRLFPQRAFLGEVIQVELRITNHGWLPLPWLQVREQLPVNLRSSGPMNQVVTVNPKGSFRISYRLDCRRRGYYPIGPLDLFSSDVLGMVATQQLRFPEEFITVYPRIIPLTQVALPSHAPLGSLRHHQPIFEDPSRVRGKRDYVSGDSLRRIDWKASASSGRLQVKLFEPSIALETMIFINLNLCDFLPRKRFDISELSIIVAASLANWIVSKRQAVGLATNGVDPFISHGCPIPMYPNRGRGHLLKILETLARVDVAETKPFSHLLHDVASSLSWGTSLILVTSLIDDDLFDALFKARRSGLNAYLVQCGPTVNYPEIRRRAEYFSFPITQIMDIKDLDLWRL